MGHLERKRIITTIDFVEQLRIMKIPSGCLHACILAMGGTDVRLDDADIPIASIDAYLSDQKLAVNTSLEIDRPVSLSQTKKLLESPKSIITELNANNSDQKIAGVLFAFGGYKNESPHVIGILPRETMTRNLRKQLKTSGEHVVVDTSRLGQPIYRMTPEDITKNLNAFILNDIGVSAHIVTRL